MKQLTIKKKITLWYTGIIAVVLGTILVLVLLFVDKVGISATEEEISAAVTGFSSNINFQDDSFYLDGDTEFYDDGIMFCIYDKNGRLLYGTIPTQFPEETILKSNTPRMIAGSNRKWMIYDSVYTYGDEGGNVGTRNYLRTFYRTFHADIRENAVDCIPITHYSDRSHRIFYDQAGIETGGSYL